MAPRRPSQPPPLPPTGTRPSYPPAPGVRQRMATAPSRPSSLPSTPPTSSTPSGAAPSSMPRSSVSTSTPSTERVTDAALSARLRSVEEDLRALTERPPSTAALSALEKRLDALSTDRPTLPEDPRIEALERRLDTALETIEALRDRIAESPSPQSMELRIEEAAPGRGEFEDRVQALEKTLDDVHHTIDESAASSRGLVDSLTSRLDAVERSLSERLDGVASTAGQVIILGSRVDELEENQQESDTTTRIAELEAQVERMQRALDAAAPRLDAFEALRIDFDALQARIEQSNGVSALEERLTRLESLPPPPAAIASLTSVKGIGPKYAKALSETGVADIAALAGLEDQALQTLAESLGVAEKKLLAWRKSARAM